MYLALVVVGMWFLMLKGHRQRTNESDCTCRKAADQSINLFFFFFTISSHFYTKSQQVRVAMLVTCYLNYHNHCIHLAASIIPVPSFVVRSSSSSPIAEVMLFTTTILIIKVTFLP